MISLSTEEDRKDGSRMKDRRRIAVIGMMLSVGMMMVGCAGAVKNETQTEVKELELTDEKQEASFSDLEEGQGVEIEGNFEGETFVATRVIIEEYD